MRVAGVVALGKLREEGIFPGKGVGLEEMEGVVDGVVERFLEERFLVSQGLGGLDLAGELVDRALRTSDGEVMDEAGVPEGERLEMVRALDRQNVMLGLYGRYVEILLPVIREIAAVEMRAVRVLELACGTGGLALELAVGSGELAVVTGSDVVPGFVEAGNLEAARRGLGVRFRVIDAFGMEGVRVGEFDVVVVSQSLHHFSPGQLAVMIARAGRLGVKRFVGIDGYRSVLLAGGVPLIASLQGLGAFMLDGLTSARKFYSEMELEIIAEIASGGGAYSVWCEWPFSVVDIVLSSEG